VASDAASDAPSDTSAPEAGGDGGPQAGCLATGGSVGTALCCASETDFPDTCGLGACSCAPASSHDVQVCNCPAGKCFDGTQCK
jgi:hypothetical protein